MFPGIEKRFNMGEFDRLRPKWADFDKIKEKEREENTQIYSQIMDILINDIISSERRMELTIQKEQVLESMDEWNQITYPDYLRLLNQRHNNKMGWTKPGC